MDCIYKMFVRDGHGYFKANTGAYFERVESSVIVAIVV